VLIELGGLRLLTDPVLRPLVAHLRRHGPTPAAPRVDTVLISHLHSDHLHLASLRELPGLPRVIAPSGTRAWLGRLGVEAEELAVGQSMDLGGVEVSAVRAEHDVRRRPAGGPSAEPLGYLIGPTPSVYFAGDTDVFDEMARLAPLDVALLPVAGWGPRLGPGHMNAERAARAVELLCPRVAIPIHWGTFHPAYARLGAWFSDPPHEFAAHVEAITPSVDVRVLGPGESTSVSA
jgi:L-ascorbate metabolism protein UlaG (beta-lactamase superfamily)